MSSYELLVHEPIRPAEISSFQPCSFTNAPNFDSGVARSGVNGPLIVGSKSDRFYRSHSRLVDAAECKVLGATHYLDDLVVLRTLVRGQEATGSGLVGGACNGAAAGCLEVRAHVGGVRER